MRSRYRALGPAAYWLLCALAINVPVQTFWDATVTPVAADPYLYALLKSAGLLCGGHLAIVVANRDTARRFAPADGGARGG